MGGEHQRVDRPGDLRDTKINDQLLRPANKFYRDQRPTTSDQQRATGKSGDSWLQGHRWCPNDTPGHVINNVDNNEYIYGH